MQDIPFFISLSSWLHGLNTTMGQTFFETVAHALSDGTKKDFISTRNTLLKIKPSQKSAIGEIITDLKNKSETPDSSRESQLIYGNYKEEDIHANSFTVDVYVETNSEITAFELKSVKPNAGEMRGDKQKILEAKAALYNTYPNKAINIYIGFPFDPTSDTSIGYDKNRFIEYPIDLKKYFALDEFLLADELWNKLSGDNNTMSQLLEIINEISTPDILISINFLNNPRNRSNPEYKSLLHSWNLHSELELVDSENKIVNTIQDNIKAQKRYNQDIIKTNGEYNFERYNDLKKLI